MLPRCLLVCGSFNSLTDSHNTQLWFIVDDVTLFQFPNGFSPMDSISLIKALGNFQFPNGFSLSIITRHTPLTLSYFQFPNGFSLWIALTSLAEKEGTFNSLTDSHRLHGIHIYLCLLAFQFPNGFSHDPAMG